MARRGRPTVQIKLSGDERKTLRRWSQRHSSSQALALRCRIVLAAAEGHTNKDIAAELNVHHVTVGKWRHRSLSPASTGSWTLLVRERLAASATM